MTQEYIQLGWGTKAHINHILRGEKLNSDTFRYALNVASTERLRAILLHLEAFPTGNASRIKRIKTRLAQLNRMNAAIDKAAAKYKLATVQEPT